MKTTKKKVKITNYKKAYEKLEIKHEKLEIKYNQLAREANRMIPTMSALLTALKIVGVSIGEMEPIVKEVIKHDV